MVGGDSSSGTSAVQEVEIKLRSQIKEKYKGIKGEFIKHCQALAKKYLEQVSQNIRRNIQNAKYVSLDEVLQDLDEMKASYVNQGLAPVFPGYEVLVAETMQDIAMKASDYLNVTHSQANSFEVKRLAEKVKDLDKQLAMTKTDHQSEIMTLQVANAKIEAERTQLHHNMTLAEDRFKRQNEEKDK